MLSIFILIIIATVIIIYILSKKTNTTEATRFNYSENNIIQPNIKLSQSENNEESIRIQVKNDIARINEIASEILKNHRQTVDLHFKKYLKVLKHKWNTLVYKDEYGDYVFDDWEREIKNLISRKLYMFTNENFFVQYKLECPSYRDSDDFSCAIISELIDLLIDEVADDANEYFTDITQLSGIEFERHVAERLNAVGWEASLTKKSGDQGGDIIAIKLHMKIIIQCKNWSSNVGNAAVQEVHAAVSFYNADNGIVISRKGFTPAARALANTTNVELHTYESFVDKYISV